MNSTANVHEFIVCANVFVRMDGKFLVLKRSSQKMYAPGFVIPFGGKLDTNEDPFTGAMRELYEEAGIKVKNVKLEAIITEIHDSKRYNCPWLIYHFSGEYAEGEIIPTEEGEAVLLSAEDLKQENLYPSLKETIDHILDESTGTVIARFKYDMERNILDKVIHVTSR